MKTPRMGILLKLTSIMVLFAALLLAVVSTLAYVNGRAALEKATSAELTATAIEKEAALDAWVAETKAHASAIAAMPAFREYVAAMLAAQSQVAIQAAQTNVVSQLLSWTGEGRDYLTWTVIHPDSGRVLAATQPDDEGKFRENHPYFINGKNGPYVQNVYYPSGGQEILSTVSAPILSADGQLLAVLAGDLNLDTIEEIVSRRTGLHTSDDAYLVNTSNLFVTQPRFVTDVAVLRRGVHTEAVKICLTQINGTSIAEDYRGLPTFIVYRWLPEYASCLIVKISQDEALAPVNTLRNTIILTGGVALLLASALAYGLAHTITRPVQEMARAAQEIGSGNLAYRVAVRGRDELGRLADTLNDMAGSLSESLEENARLYQKTRAWADELEQLEVELTRSNKDLQQFAYIASHDLQEPLRVIGGYLQLLQRRYGDKLGEDAERFITGSVNASQRMRNLIEDLLSFSRVGTHGNTLDETDSGLCVARAMVNLQKAIQESEAVITFDPLPTVVADASQLAQVFQNLIANAIKFKDEKVPRVHVSAHRQPDTHEWVFSVRDNGIGLDMQYAERIFLIFQRLHSRTEYAGSGIGLAVCKRIVERHAGRIWVESEVGKGAEFFFTLPDTV